MVHSATVCSPAGMLGLSVASRSDRLIRVRSAEAPFIPLPLHSSRDCCLIPGRSLKLDAAFHSPTTTNRYRLAAVGSMLPAYLFVSRPGYLRTRWLQAPNLIPVSRSGADQHSPRAARPLPSRPEPIATRYSPLGFPPQDRSTRLAPTQVTYLTGGPLTLRSPSAAIVITANGSSFQARCFPLGSPFQVGGQAVLGRQL